MIRHLAAALVAGALSCAAQIQGPISGYVLDSRSHALRPVNGIPGAATLGPALSLPFALRLAAAGRDFAVVSGFDENNGLYLARGLASGSPSLVALEGALADVSAVAWNDAGDAAVLHSRTAGRLQVISGLPAEPRVAASFDAGRVVAAMALSAPADRVVVAGDDGVYLFSPSGGEWNGRVLDGAPGVSALLFRNGGRGLVFANKTVNQIMSIDDVDGAGGITVLAGEADGVSEPVALASANDGRELWAANAGSSALLVFDTAVPGPPQQVTLAAAPSRCDPLDWKSLLILNEVGRAPLLVLDWARDRTVFFVPVD